MNKSILAFAAVGGCGAIVCAQAQESAAVYTRELSSPTSSHALVPGPAGLPGASLYGPFGSDFSAYRPGREYSLEYLALADMGDPSGGSRGGHAAGVIANGNRRGDSIEFFSPPVGGLSAGASYSRDASSRDPSNRAWGMSLGFNMGPVTLRAAHQNKHVAKVRLYDLAGNNMEAKNSLIAANVRFGWGTAYAAFSANNGWGSTPLFNPDNPYSAAVASTPSTDSRDVLMGVAVPVGRSTTFLASYIHKNDRDRANRDSNELALGASYTVTRRTDFYAAYSYIQNLSIAGMPRTSSDARGHTSSALSFGMRHAF
jgi:predicted porin